MPPSRKKKVGQERQDKYYHLAKEYGYRSRAAFKLIQLNKKYDFLSRAQCVVDLCAAPGGWLQVARKYMPMTGVLIGVDLANIRNIKNVKCITGDITTKKCLADIKQELMGHKADVVLHDGAPNVGSNWLKDAYTQSELVLSALKMACELLKPRGIFVSKVFRSNDYTALLWLFNQFFEKVEATKPKASRYTSAEIYVIGFGYKAPKEIDAKLFNPNFVFEEVAPKTKLELGYQKKLRKQKRAEGYDEEFEGTIIRRKASVAQFINSNTPVSFAAQHNVLEFDEESKMYLEHPDTTNEIKELCKDLQRMGRYDFKVLLRWRQKMIEFRDEVEGADGGATTGGESEYEQLDEPMEEENKDVEELDEEELQRELEELRKKSLKVKKQLQKRRREKEKKRMPRTDLLTEEQTDLLDTYTGGDELFSLKTIKSVEDLKRSTENVEKDLDYIALEEEEHDEEEPVVSDDDDDDDDEEKWDRLIEENLDKQYEYYLEKKGNQRRKLEKLLKKKEKQREELMEALKHDEEHNFASNEEKNPLIAEFENTTSESRKESQWFGQNIFNVLREEAEERASKKRKLSSGEAEATKKDVDLGYDDDDLHEHDSDDDDDMDSSSDDGDYEELKNKMKQLNKEGDGFEVVPQELHDENTRATTIAIAKKLLKKKQRRQFVDDAYNRYAFNDDDLPKWFVDDELKHMRRIPMVTKEDIEREKQLERELNARPAKKVLEAQLRKKKRTANKLKKLQEKATQIAENHEMTAREKQIELEKLYKKATKENKKTITVVSTKGRIREGVSRTTSGAKVKYVDKRAKKDTRHSKKTAQKLKRKRK